MPHILRASIPKVFSEFIGTMVVLFLGFLSRAQTASINDMLSMTGFSRNRGEEVIPVCVGAVHNVGSDMFVGRVAEALPTTDIFEFNCP